MYSPSSYVIQVGFSTTWLFHVLEIEYHFKQYTGVTNTLKVTVSVDRIWYVKQNSYELKTIMKTQMHVYQHSFAKCQQDFLRKGLRLVSEYVKLCEYNFIGHIYMDAFISESKKN